jgi:hypothetical protein
MSSKMGDEARIDDIDEIAGFRAVSEASVMVAGGARASADKWMGWESEELWARVVWPGGGGA